MYEKLVNKNYIVDFCFGLDCGDLGGLDVGESGVKLC